MEMDNETLQTVSEGERVQRLVEGEDWTYIKDLFSQEIMDLQSIKNLTGTTPEEVILDIKARNTAIDILMGIITKVEGRAAQHQGNKGLIPNEPMLININL